MIGDEAAQQPSAEVSSGGAGPSATAEASSGGAGRGPGSVAVSEATERPSKKRRHCIQRNIVDA